MWKNSNELLDYAIRELQKAMKENEEKVEIKIELTDCFTGNSKQDIKKFADKLKIKEATEKLREQYVNYTIRSRVQGGDLNAIISFKSAPCEIAYKLFWELILLKKEA